MARRKTIEKSDSDAVANPESVQEQAKPATELPFFESPPVSPENSDNVAKTDIGETSAKSPTADVGASSRPKVTMLTAIRSRFIFRPRHKRHALLAASVVIAAAFGVIVGAAATGSFSKPAVDVAVEENKAIQQSLARLAREVASLKTSLDAASKSAHGQITKLTERLNRDSTENTGSIAPPIVAGTPQLSGPLPVPRPTAAASEPPAPRLSIVPDWSIRETRDGYIYVQVHGGDIYQVVRGAPLPGLGPVEQIKRQDGRWMVVTPKGIIVSMRDRRYFEQF
jgi:hypothetical protein